MYEFIVTERLAAAGQYLVTAATRGEALQKVLDNDESVCTLGEPEFHTVRPMTVRDVKRGVRVA